LSIIYKIVSGDTLELISKKVWGAPLHALHIKSANPGLVFPLIVGTTITIPQLPDYPGDLPQILGISGENDIQIYIDGQRFEFWTDLTIKRSLDSVDVVNFSLPFDPFAPGYSDVFRPFTYKTITVSIGFDVLLTGVIIAHNPQITNSGNTLNISGYSLPGVLQDCTAPASSFPLEFNNIGLIDIAKALSKPFGLSVLGSVDDGANFDNVAMQPSGKIFDFLADLARQRNLVISSTEKGEMRFWQSIEPENPIAELEIGKAPVTSIIPTFNEQEYYSHVTGISFVSTGVPGAQYTDKNPFLPGTVRPFTFGATDTNNVNIKTATKAKTGRMFANMMSYEIEVSTWRDKGGDLWKPNTVVQVYAPEAMIYNKYNFIVRSVEFRRDRNSETATLELMPPGGFDGKLPEKLPWDL
jgi:prophage tail gpP-like protein